MKNFPCRDWRHPFLAVLCLFPGPCYAGEPILAPVFRAGRDSYHTYRIPALKGLMRQSTWPAFRWVGSREVRLTEAADDVAFSR